MIVIKCGAYSVSKTYKNGFRHARSRRVDREADLYSTKQSRRQTLQVSAFILNLFSLNVIQ